MRANPDTLAAMEEERRFLLRSLADLDREYAAGDVDDADYRELRDGYTARAAAALRAIDAGRAELASRPPTSWRRRAVTGAITVALIGVVWWALSASSAQRLPGQEITGLDPRDEVQQLLSQARAAQLSDPASAAALYAEVLDQEPDHAEALTYRGWTLALATIRNPEQADSEAQLVEAVELLAAATELDPTYPDPYCFRGIIEYRFFGDPELALPFVDGCLAAGPPADVRALVEGLREQIVAEVPATPSDSGG